MKELVVVSGKGGTGKTSIVAALARLADGAVFADCDVDAANLSLLLGGEPRRHASFVGGKRARIRASLCAGCGSCEEVCRFSAITSDGPRDDGLPESRRIDPVACEGCGACTYACPSPDAILLEPEVSGVWSISDTAWGSLVHAELEPGEESSGKLVTLVRREARRLAQVEEVDLVVSDGPPGVGCPAIAAMTGADLVLAVTEPTPSGLHDLWRVLDLAAHFEVPAAIFVNKWDLNPELADRVTAEAESWKAQVLGRLRYDERVTHALVRGDTILDGPEDLAEGVRALWRRLETLLDGRGPRPALPQIQIARRR